MAVDPSGESWASSDASVEAEECGADVASAEDSKASSGAVSGGVATECEGYESSVAAAWGDSADGDYGASCSSDGAVVGCSVGSSVCVYSASVGSGLSGDAV